MITTEALSKTVTVTHDGGFFTIERHPDENGPSCNLDRIILSDDDAESLALFIDICLKRGAHWDE